MIRSKQSTSFPRASGVRRRWRSLGVAILSVLIVSSGVALSAQASTARLGHRAPVGAVKLRKTGLKRVSGVLCGKVRGRWIPGTMVSSAYFLSDAQQAHNYAALARRANGRAKKTDLTRSRWYSQRAKKRGTICSKTSGSGTTNPPAGGLPTSTPTPLRFNLTSAIGLALQGMPGAAQDRFARLASDTGSNLEAVNAAGQLSNAVASGNATISHFLIAPNHEVYVVFGSPVDLADTSRPMYPGGCLLAEIDPSTGVPMCVDSSLSSINWSGSGLFGASAPIQFDSSGAIYYSGMTTSGQTVLRKYDGSTTRNLITDNVYLRSFVVTTNGTVVVTGTTTSTGAPWTRRISPSGSLETLEGSQAWFLSLFPDGNVYMGSEAYNGSITSGSGWPVVARYLVGSDQMDPEWWIADSSTPVGGAEYFDAHSICGSPTASEENLCEGGEATLTWQGSTGDGREFVVASGQNGGTLVEYYPTLRFLSSEVTTVRVVHAVNGNLAVAGTNASGQNVLTLYNTTSDTETQLIGPGNETEIYHLNYVASENKLVFDGLRFADNAYVIGEVDLNTDQVSVINAGSTKWADLQTFG